ncbi:MAG: cysteine desulfurase [Lachnospiraceae bacterium]|nr:cysteine desulfurase [Lachnospiraceae bacterium]
MIALIYLDNAATAPPTIPEINSPLLDYMTYHFGNPDSPHFAGEDASRYMNHARSQVARLLHTNYRNVYFTSGGTESNNIAIYHAATLAAKYGKKHIITSLSEHASVLEPIRHLQDQLGFRVDFLTPGRKGYISAEQIRDAIRPDTGFVSLMYVNNETGAVTPVEEIGKMLAEKRIAFHVDCVQAAGFYDLNPAAMCATYLSVSAHKIHGPMGSGCIYTAHPDIGLYGIMYGGHQEGGARPGTPNVPGIIGFGLAAQYAMENRERNEKIIRYNAALLSGLLIKIPGCHPNFNLAFMCPRVMSFRFDDVDADTLVAALDIRGVCVSTGAACNSHAVEPSSVLLASGLDFAEAASTIRVSLSALNTEYEMRKAAEIIREAVTFLRSR